ncbi:S1C family serine protease [Krasilnikoviella flava]|uniref:Putative serine protease PepD n=1 Tax=Krasilnikoviella flava TaxID=526729 RepID=A0A1T5J6U0_9MICO|nr:trypsin-like peptidase domain-containing protein [Krasilnikoviella flava]SKC47109.1 putative serine protease PepD [Krasilnikoviella flava]
MSTDTPGAPQPSGADEPNRSATPHTEQPTEQQPAAERAPQPDAQDTQHLTVQPTQQIPTQRDQQPPAPPQPTAPQQPTAQQPRYGQMAPGSPYYNQQQHPQGQYHQQQGQHPQGQHPQGQPYGQGPANPYAVGQTSAQPGGPEGSVATTRQRSVWVPVASAAVIAAVLASLGTAAATGAFDAGNPSSLASVGTNQQSTDEAPVKNSTSSNPDWEAVTTAVAPSVVAIQVQSQAGGAEGSGVIYDDQGHIVTNNHVVSGAENGTVQVTLSDGRLYEATIVGTDPTTDLAVVKLKDPPDDLKAASIGSADDVTVGDAVLAVGNPLGLANTATTGIVSALDRPVSATGEDGSTQVVTNAIQIDAAINPGNSGGPLFNAQGQVIGITSSIATLSSGMGESQSGSIGLGFAIPVNLATNIADQLIKNGTAEHAFLGVTMQDATATADGVTRRGAQVVEVSSGSPAAEAGIQAGDVIVAIDDDSVNGAESLTAYVREKAADQKVTLTYVRDGKTQTVDVALAVRDESSTTGQGSGDQNGQGDQGQDGQGQGDQGQDGQGQGDQGQDGSSDSTDPGNLPGWLRDLLQGGN